MAQGQLVEQSKILPPLLSLLARDMADTAAINPIAAEVYIACMAAFFGDYLVPVDPDLSLP